MTAPEPEASAGEGAAVATCLVCDARVTLLEAPLHAEDHAQRGEYPFQCNPSCHHGTAPHLYLGAIDPNRCSACAAYPSIPCTQHLAPTQEPAR